MNNEKILEGIESYCADNESDYAIMITGPWGTGKTYFANNKIKRFLAEKGKKTAYVSLFGITKNEEIDHLVIQAVYPFVKSSIFKLGSAVAQTAVKTAASLHQIDLVLPQLLIPIGNLIIIFDDLERSAKSIDITELIGYINRYCSQRHVKCIIVCNEEEIDKLEYSTSDQGKTAYRIAKEKTVRYTYKYEFALDQILAYLSGISFHEAEKVSFRFIEAERNTLNLLPKDYEVNARILITVYHLVTRLVIKSDHIINETHYDDFIENVSRCILAYLVEHKNHQIGIKEVTETIQAQATLAFDLSSLMQRNREENKWHNDTRDKRNIYTRIREGFFPERQFIYLSSTAAQLAYHGVAFEKDINEEFCDFVDKAFPERDPVKILFSDYSLLNDTSFSEALDESLRRLRNDDLSLSGIIHMVYFLEYFLKEELTKAYDGESLLRHATNATDRLLLNSTTSVDQNELTHIPSQYPNLDGIAKQVSDHAQGMFPRVEEGRLKQHAQDAWKELCTDQDVKTLYQTFGLQSEWNRNVFFGYLETEEVLSGIDTMSNSVKKALAEMILTRYTKSPYQHIAGIFDKEKGRLDAVRNSLRSEIKNGSEPKLLSSFMKKRIMVSIDAAFEKYTT